MTSIRIGSRSSRIALWQASLIQKQISKLGLASKLFTFDTQGDQLKAAGPVPTEGKGFYTRELEDALLNEEIDLAIHTMKDLPTRSPEGLCLTALSKRENPSDWLLVRKDVAVKKLFRLSAKAKVAASTNRRKAQLLHYRPDLEVVNCLEDPDQILEGLRRMDWDAALIAAASLIQLETDLSDFEVIRFNAREFVPAPGQGVIALQSRRDDLETRRALKALHHPEVARCTNVERSVLRLFDDASHLPLGVYCERDSLGHYHVWAAMAEKPGDPLKQVQFSQSTTDGLAARIFELLRE
ncbi:MAG: hydroxymethylbilane synthase [Bacteroidetes bacterium]|nr:hydroxymethylbilane synthase [Bacteroidota bacterium]